MDVRIGIIQAPKELDIELGEGTSQEDVLAEIEQAFALDAGILWLTDKRGRKVAVPVARIAYVEVGAQDTARRVGFGAS